ncbi:MAG: hypothetical protein WBD51_00225, partial [Burkholderiaceae bacterium]
REQELVRLNESVERLRASEQQLSTELNRLREDSERTDEGNNGQRKRKKKKKHRVDDSDRLGLSELRSAPAGENDVMPGHSVATDSAESGPVNGGDSVLPEDGQVSAPRQFHSSPGQVDNLKEIKGIGPVLERRLNQLGVFQFRQIAAWTQEDIEFFDDHLADFRGRIRRDNWVQSASQALTRKYG